MEDLLIIKIGGHVIDDEPMLEKFLDDISKINEKTVLVHGGGKMASRLSKQLGIETKMHEGRRITDEDTLKVVTMVYAGWINKSISARLNAKGKKAIGLCGADAGLIPANRRKPGNIDFGFVGDVVPGKINNKALQELLNNNTLPVIAPITFDSEGQLLNTNADTIASSLATALASLYRVRLIFGFELEGVRKGETLITDLNMELYQGLKILGHIKDGMIPKLDNSFTALKLGVEEVVIGRANDINLIIQKNAGTKITLS